MRKTLQTGAFGLLGLVGLAALSGCQGAVVGNWYLAEAVPNREVLSLDDVSFRKDGSFTATTTIEGLTTQEAGTYVFNGWQLKLRPNAGGQRTYSAVLKGKRLEITSGRRKVVLKKR